jgi:hypothetical protein
MTNLRVREADACKEREPLLKILRNWLAPEIDEKRLDWLYFRNPHGNARIWVLEDSDGMVGAGAAIPRKLWSSGAQIPGCVFGDFCVAPAYRTIGPALQLQRACLQAIDSGWSRLGYDLPSTSMMAVYRRLGIREARSFMRMAKPLRVDRQVRERVKSGILAKFVSQSGNAALKARDRIRRTGRKLETTLCVHAFGEEFDELFNELAPKTGNWCVERCSAYLNWRFREHPKAQFTVWTARQKGKLEAYCITRSRDQEVQIVELFGKDEYGVHENLLMTVIESSRASGALTLSAPILSGHPRQARLEALGFYAREASAVVAYEKGSSGVSPSWLTEGDRDS